MVTKIGRCNQQREIVNNEGIEEEDRAVEGVG